MLEYDWGSQPMVMLPGTGDDQGQDCDHSRHQFYDHYTQAFNDAPQLVNPPGFAQPTHHPHLSFHQTAEPHFNSLYDPRASFGASFPPHHSQGMLSIDPDPTGFMVVPKSEPGSGVVDFSSRIGLNLGGRTYFSSAESDFVNRLYRRSRPLEAGSVNSPRCQAEGCNADLTHAKHYHRRHKVCEFHSKAAAVVAAGLTQRFCQQCSRFHVLTEFDNGKRSCRKRLADHNRRRRKSNNQAHSNPKSHFQNNSSPDNLPRSPQDSGAQSSSSVTVAISPPRISLDGLRQRSYQGAAAATTSSPSTSSLFYLNG